MATVIILKYFVKILRFSCVFNDRHYEFPFDNINEIILEPNLITK